MLKHALYLRQVLFVSMLLPDGTVYPLNKKNSVLTHDRKLPKRGEE